ncbi:MAG TPA: UDP-N-acetylglucosamine 2-epimerase (non-hydrolyzing) [Bryobacteraceae bacterium]|jgi:UDP-N-acetylglucosamine 2-epimerase (non-hydrolysing)|nr:UDP-N-acetylglucosamine 2-epimerase (non-hydrolyzing) [Bryobacteraceae bacterium]
MKIVTLLGTRPEIIRLSLVIPLLDRLCEHILVHTGQNYDDRLSQIFFDELEVRKPDVHMGVRAPGFGGQIGQILERSEALFLEHRPDRLLILGDTNSGLAALIARRLGIPVYHMEAGNRCYDDRVPEEVNRRVIDHSSSVLMPYTNRSRENLLAEGIPGNRVYVTGNPIKQVIDRFSDRIGASTALETSGLERGRFFLVTLHRAENVDIESRLRSFLDALGLLHREFGFPVVCSLHPRTRSKIEAFGINLERAGISFLEPLGFFDFVHLEQSAFCLLSDSGTVQEEACIFGVPNVTIRDVTERPETLDCGSNILSGANPGEVVRAVSMVTAQSCDWKPPEEYLAPAVAETVCRIVLGYRIPDAAELAWRNRA